MLEGSYAASILERCLARPQRIVDGDFRVGERLNVFLDVRVSIRAKQLGRPNQLLLEVGTKECQLVFDCGFSQLVHRNAESVGSQAQSAMRRLISKA